MSAVQPSWLTDADGEPCGLDQVIDLLMTDDNEPIPYMPTPTPLVLVYG